MIFTSGSSASRGLGVSTSSGASGRSHSTRSATPQEAVWGKETRIKPLSGAR